MMGVSLRLCSRLLAWRKECFPLAEPSSPDTSSGEKASAVSVFDSPLKPCPQTVRSLAVFAVPDAGVFRVPLFALLWSRLCFPFGSAVLLVCFCPDYRCRGLGFFCSSGSADGVYTRPLPAVHVSPSSFTSVLKSVLSHSFTCNSIARWASRVSPSTLDKIWRSPSFLDLVCLTSLAAFCFARVQRL